MTYQFTLIKIVNITVSNAEFTVVYDESTYQNPTQITRKTSLLDDLLTLLNDVPIISPPVPPTG